MNVLFVSLLSTVSPILVSNGIYSTSPRLTVNYEMILMDDEGIPENSMRKMFSSLMLIFVGLLSDGVSQGERRPSG